MPQIIASINSQSLVVDDGKPSYLEYHSDEANKDPTKQQHQQFVLGLGKKIFLQENDVGK